MDPVVMVAFEVGTEKTKLVGKYADGKLSAELKDAAKFGKLSDLLKQYGVPVDSWPRFFQDAAAVEGWLWVLEYQTMSIGTTKDTTLTANSFSPAPADKILEELIDAVIKTDQSDANKEAYTITKAGKELHYSITKNGEEYTIEAKVYKLLIQAYYEKSFSLVPGLLGLKSIAFGLTNDTALAATEFEKQCREVLDKVPGVNAIT